MALSLLELFRVLSSFSPPRVNLAQAPWEEYVPYAIAQGLAPLAAYNLEYRLGQTGAPSWARDQLLAIYQGSANDGVMKLVNFKRLVDELEGRRLVLLGGASYAESLYPHVAFRPILDVRLMVAPDAVEPLVGYVKRGDFRVDAALGDPGRATRVLSDGRTVLLVHGGLSGDAQLDHGLLSRAVPMKVYGPSVYRLELEDALVVEALLTARAGFQVPLLHLIDARELVLGAPSTGGVYSRPVDAAAVRQRASQLDAERALYCLLGVVERLFPETAGAVAPLRPSLLLPVREVLDRLVVGPASEVGRTVAFRGEDVLRHLLTGG